MRGQVEDNRASLNVNWRCVIKYFGYSVCKRSDKNNGVGSVWPQTIFSQISVSGAKLEQHRTGNMQFCNLVCISNDSLVHLSKRNPSPDIPIHPPGAFVEKLYCSASRLADINSPLPDDSYSRRRRRRRSGFSADNQFVGYCYNFHFQLW